MKNLAIIILVLAFAPIVQAQLKIGVLDMNLIFTSYHKTGEAEAKLNAARTEAKAELDKKIDKLKAAMNEVNDLNTELLKNGPSEEVQKETKKKRDNKVAEVRELDKEIAELRAAQERTLLPADLTYAYERRRKDILEDIMKIVNAKCIADSYDIVFDKSGFGSEEIPIVTVGRNTDSASKTTRGSSQIPIVVYSHDTIVDFTKEVIEALAKK